ncbi:NAD-dependent epimerase/dehydratase family protein [Kribbella deserti]|uniref:NAD-dependent epimerase/dehydratase family protein n=1 Tax=Kribbella deserti TaxID=1926257 RepID=A0ABV6QEQ8_9ACTN
MRVVVTGASGNVGSALLRRLGQTDHSVIAVARRLPASVVGGRDVRWVSADLSTADSVPVLLDAMEGADAVVHLAWAFQPSHDLRYLEELGVGGTRRVVDAAMAAGVAHVVHMSSVGAYSPKWDGAPVDESWPTEGVPSSSYSRHKSAAERLLDSFETAEAPVITRLRPGIVGQRSAGSALLRYGLPPVIPSKALGAVPMLPLPRGLTVPVVHADDLADAILRVLERRIGGPFNLAAPSPVTSTDLASALGARLLPAPAVVVRAAMAAAWHARLQPVSPGWFDLAVSAPMMSSARARDELDWYPQRSSISVLAETFAGMRAADAGETPVLRQRTVAGELKQLFRDGPISRRPLP